MRALGGQVEEHFARRLRYELDAMVIRFPPARPARHHHRSRFIYGVLSPLILAAAATVAFMPWASDFTGSTNPAVWTQPGAWSRSTGVTLPSPSPSPSSRPKTAT